MKKSHYLCAILLVLPGVNWAQQPSAVLSTEQQQHLFNQRSTQQQQQRMLNNQQQEQRRLQQQRQYDRDQQRLSAPKSLTPLQSKSNNPLDRTAPAVTTRHQ
ncbi:Uncharacterised protein [Yersinia frederiksenii]|uniref:hypothetical protein n=1 Tax=Yersinia alsatica TaxID=2890317 RepID=UPI0005E898C2|nr:hypothetical protein [Yersinia alsatica]CFQ66054.1 Uncharacterised protein [Yersinia frederiksenii]CNI81473.1 Uncharacterised protein [Yersinia frederiksenii]